ncbi:hypothetical protein BC832DRAFT_593963 [Gaertneriomyces semiglobifer]|nr:hypothetical protein BC832DRAFT_593963 [Gaertneriomyces semiglobifer]
MASPDSPQTTSSVVNPESTGGGTVTATASRFLTQRGYPSLEKAAERPGLTPYPAWAASALCITSAIPSMRGLRGYPGYFPLVCFGAVFAGSGYMMNLDIDNGTSTATAWGVIYTSLFLRSSLTARKPGPIALLAGIVGMTGVYGVETWDSVFG